jgi:hypothetical protein
MNYSLGQLRQGHHSSYSYVDFASEAVKLKQMMQSSASAIQQEAAYSQPAAKVHICEVCSKPFGSRYHVQRHMKLHAPCSVCKQSFMLPTALKAHMRNEHQLPKKKADPVRASRNSDSASVEERKANLLSRLQKDVTEFSEATGPDGSLLSWNFLLNTPNPARHERKRKGNEESNLFSMEPLEDLWCDSCGLSFKYRYKFKRHIKRHFNEPVNPSSTFAPEWQCVVCMKTFATAYNLKRHTDFHCHESNHPFKCEHCPKTFGLKNAYLEHVKKHEGGEDVIDLSSQGLRVPTDDQERRELMLEMKPWKLTSWYLSSGMSVGEQFMECKYCDKSFSANYFKRHILRVHINKKSKASPLFECEVCKVSFRQKANFEEHKAKHAAENGPKPLEVCTLCSKSFSSSRLTLHMKSCQEVRFHCEVCYVIFNTQTELDSHLQLKHSRPQSEGQTDISEEAQGATIKTEVMGDEVC